MFQREQKHDGVSLREHYNQYFEATGKRHEGDVVVALPVGSDWYWRAYLDMIRSRPPGNGFTVGRMGVQDIEAWARCQALQLLPWEYELFVQLEAEWQHVVAEHIKQDTPSDG